MTFSIADAIESAQRAEEARFSDDHRKSMLDRLQSLMRGLFKQEAAE